MLLVFLLRLVHVNHTSRWCRVKCQGAEDHKREGLLFWWRCKGKQTRVCLLVILLETSAGLLFIFTSASSNETWTLDTRWIFWSWNSSAETKWNHRLSELKLWVIKKVTDVMWHLLVFYVEKWVLVTFWPWSSASWLSPAAWLDADLDEWIGGNEDPCLSLAGQPDCNNFLSVVWNS